MDIKELLEKYPFLKYRNVFSDEETAENPLEDNWFTAWDNTGWKDIWQEFLLKLCKQWETWDEEAKKSFRIFDTKEKWGRLRSDWSGGTDEAHNLEWGYEMLSGYTCIKCGKQPRDSKGNRMIWNSKGWIAPYCKDCAKKDFYEHKNMYKKGIKWKDVFTRDVHKGRFYITSYSKEKGETKTYFDDIL